MRHGHISTLAMNMPVIVSDMHMPTESGAEFLGAVQQKHPLTTRIMMTADNDQDVAARAVNEGAIFRFLRKPCKSVELAKSLRDGMEHHRLLSVERELLEETLRGSISLLVDILSDLKPLAFGRSSRVKRMVEQICEKKNFLNAWELKIAATLSQIGCISLSDEVLEAIHNGTKPKAVDEIEFNKHPAFGEKLLQKIPRLEQVSQLVGNQLRHFEDLERLFDCVEQRKYAAIIAVCVEFDRLTAGSKNKLTAIEELKALPKRFSKEIVEVIETIVQEKRVHRTVAINELKVGMILESDVRDDRGSMLIAKGQEISEVVLNHLQRRAMSIQGGITVCVDLD